METVWYCLIAFLIAMYVVFDGFDLGAGIIHLWAARTGDERRLVLRSIGPVWDGNEVWLLAGGGSLFLAFPALYASSFSGFYLPLMIVLWLLMLRGIAIEFRSHLQGPAWGPFWDVVFSLSSALLAVFYGAALGNVVRGVPLDASGTFFLPLWADFTLGPPTGILDWYTALVGVTALTALALHGSLWVARKTEADLHDRARRFASAAWWPVVLLTALVTLATFHIQPHIPGRLHAHPWGLVFPLVAAGGLVAVRIYVRRQGDDCAFYSSCAFLLGLLASAAFGLYPYVLPATVNPTHSLTVANAAAPAYGLRIALWWFVPGVILAAGYFRYTYGRFAGKVQLDEPGY